MRRLRRSCLITPGDNYELLQKLAVGPEDVAVIELEDGVHQSQKEMARQTVRRALEDLPWGRRERLVRINAVTSADGRRDVEIVAVGKPDAVLLPKVHSDEEIRWACSLLAQAEEAHGLPANSIGIWAMIESAQALLHVEEICHADPRMSGVIFGGGDLGADLQVKRLGLGSFRRLGPSAFEYFYGRGRTVAAARAAGIDPIDVGHSTYTDLDGTRTSAEMSAQLGFSGVIAFSPRQVPIVNEVFTPPPEDIKWANEVMAKFEAVGKEQRTVCVVDGEMIDGPFVRNAQQILARRDAIVAASGTSHGGDR